LFSPSKESNASSPGYAVCFRISLWLCAKALLNCVYLPKFEIDKAVTKKGDTKPPFFENKISLGLFEF
tara:strand:- start:314 stop:517 length:204 start_codon:yes stop_codon:yes gene_type:complete